MKKKSEFKLSRTGKGYAFEIEEGLCNWAFPEYTQQERRELPSPEAEVVKVRIIKESDFRKLYAAYKLILDENKKVNHEKEKS